MPVKHYTLYVDDGFGVNFTPIHQCDCHEHLVEGLTPGISYSFKIVASNFNGEGEFSDTVQLKSCISPKKFLAPTLVSTTSTSIKLRWRYPEDMGCPIQSYSILSDLGDTESGIVHSIDPLQVENEPYKFEHTFVDSQLTGKTLRFRL